MQFNSPRILLVALTGIVFLLFSSCTKDILDDTEILQATQLKAATSKTVSLAPIQDAYLQGGSRYNSSNLRLEENRRQGYLMFDLSAVDGKIMAASLQFTIGSDPGNGTVKAYLGNGSNWTETNLSTQNRPSTGALLGSINKSYASGATQKITLNASSLEKGKTSLILVHSNGNDLNFSSSETSQPPKLTITYRSSGSGSSSSATESKSSAIDLIQDAYLQDGTLYNSSIIRLEGNRRHGYLMFDLSHISGKITSASLQFTISSDPGNGTIKAYLGNGTSWTETNLSTQNKPSTVAILGSINKSYSIGATEKIKLNSTAIKKGKISLILMHSNGNDLAFASGETSNAPKLLLTYSGMGPSGSSPNLGSNEIDSDDITEKSTVAAKGYYVTVNGKSTNNGLSESSAWSLKQAFRVARPGDIIYVKAGNYGNLSLSTYYPGLPGKPIKYIGYTNTPGDLVSSGGSTFKYGDKLDSNKMPLLQGTGKGYGILVDKPYTEVENFQITKYEKGFYSTGKYGVFQNIIVTQVGDLNSSRYSGYGISLGGDYTKASNCIVINAGGEGLRINNASHQVHDNNKVYSDHRTNPTDYYYLLVNNATNNIIRNAYVERVGNLSHGGHGLVLKIAATNNELIDCTVKNTIIECSFKGVNNNTFTGNKVIGGSTGSGAILVANGAHHNTFRNCSVDNAGGISFQDWIDGNKSVGDSADAGNNNQFIKCKITNGDVGINFHSWAQLKAPAHANTFTDCEFINMNTLFQLDRPNNNNKMLNCKIQNVRNYSQSRWEGRYRLNISINSSTQFINNGFSRP